MKFIHIADVHLDMPFKLLGNLGEKRRLEQIEAMQKLIEYIKKNNIEYLFISGDFYEHDYIRNTTTKTIIESFSNIPNTKIYISPGNHDPYIKNSEYEKNNWPNNVHIFKNYEVIEEDNVNIYGYGFTDFYDNGIDLNDIEILENGKKNIFVIHGDLASSESSEGVGNNYNPLYLKKLSKLGFDYVALGHIHKSNFKNDNHVLYPGSFLSYRFSDDNAGAIVGEFKKGYTYTFSDNHREEGFRSNEEEQLYLNHISFDDSPFLIEDIDISDVNSKEELVGKINNLKFKENSYIKLIIKGNKNFEFTTNYLLDNINNSNIITIKDESKNTRNLEEIATENTLRGIFVKKALEKITEIKATSSDYKNDPEYLNMLKAIEIVLDEME